MATEQVKLMMSSGKTDMTNLAEATGGDKALMAKYVLIFLETCPQYLEDMENAMAADNSQLLYSTLHTLKSQVALMGMNEILPGVQAALEHLRAEKKLTGLMRETIRDIANEIELACGELDVLRKDLA